MTSVNAAAWASEGIDIAMPAFTAGTGKVPPPAGTECEHPMDLFLTPYILQQILAVFTQIAASWALAGGGATAAANTAGGISSGCAGTSCHRAPGGSSSNIAAAW